MERIEDLLNEFEGLDDAIGRDHHWASIPYVPSGPVIISRAAAAGPVALTMTGGAKVIAAEKARLAAEKARTKEAAKDAKLVAAMHQIKMLKAFIKAAGLKVPTL
jgi:hypothetical protein